MAPMRRGVRGSAPAPKGTNLPLDSAEKVRPAREPVTAQAGGHVKAGAERSGGTERSGAPPGGLGLDGEPPGSRVPLSRGVGGRNIGHQDTRDQGAEGGTKRPFCSQDDSLAVGTAFLYPHSGERARH